MYRKYSQAEMSTDVNNASATEKYSSFFRTKSKAIEIAANAATAMIAPARILPPRGSTKYTDF